MAMDKWATDWGRDLAALQERVTELEKLTSPESTLIAISTGQQVDQNRDAIQRISKAAETRIIALEQRQSKDEARFRLILRGFSIVIPLLISGLLGLNLSDESLKRLEPIFWGLFTAGGAGAIAAPLLEEKEG